MTEHRVPMRSVSLRRHPDPASSRDPQVRALVTALAQLPAPEPRAHFQAELRAQLVAVAPRLVADGAAAERPLTNRPDVRSARHADRAGRFARLPGISLARPLTIAASVITVLALLLGGAVVMSRRALPGDALYGLKRASERVQLTFDSSDAQKAQDHLEFASTRAAEVQGLLRRSSTGALGAGISASGAINAGTAALITEALASADSDVKAAAQLLNRDAVRHRSAAPLATMTSWAPGQLARMNAILAELPAGALRTRSAESTYLVAAALHRATSLRSKVTCSCMGTSPSDELGPLPCHTCPAAVAPSAAPRRSTAVPTKRTAGIPPVNAPSRSTTGPTTGPTTGTVRRTGRPNATSPTSATSPTVPGVPTGPTVKVSVSVSVSVPSCPVLIGPGPIGVRLPVCKTSASASHP